MKPPIRNVEELFLKISKITVLLVMGLALIAALILVIAALYQYAQSPKEPAPAKMAPAKAVDFEELKQWLIEQGMRDNELPKQQPVERKIEQPIAQPRSALFQEDAETLYRCSEIFGKRLGTEAGDAAESILELRLKIEGDANASSLRGDVWVKDAVAFACKALKDDSIVALKKAGKINAVFMPVLKYHLMAWDKIQGDKRQFEQAEEFRVASERNAETARVVQTKAAALTHLIFAASAFGLFMILALLLLCAKIENNLRDINESIRANGRLSA